MILIITHTYELLKPIGIKKMQEKEEHIIQLAIDYSKGELSVQAKLELEELLAESKENRSIFDSYREKYHKARSVAFLSQMDEEKAWGRIRGSIKKPEKKSRKLHLWIPYAAAIAILISVSTFFLTQHQEKVLSSKEYNFSELAQVGSRKAFLTLANGSKVTLHEEIEQQIAEADGTKITKDSANNITYLANADTKQELLYNTINVPRGGEYSLTLSDGTKVWLNSDTELRYPVKFSKDKRDVYLVGEAYLEVAHNKEAPFTVHTHDSEVVVLGTKFNISSYEDQEFIATTLVEGSVQINNLTSTEILEPGDQSMIVRGSSRIDIAKVDTGLYTSWVNGVFEFENMELEYIMAQLGRWYDVKFFFKEEQQKHIRFTGAIKRDKPFEFMLEMIEQVEQVKFSVKDEHIIVGR